MKPGERSNWRKLAAAAQKVADSKNYAEEYMAKVEFRNNFHKLPMVAGPVPANLDP